MSLILFLKPHFFEGDAPAPEVITGGHWLPKKRKKKAQDHNVLYAPPRAERRVEQRPQPAPQITPPEPKKEVLKPSQPAPVDLEQLSKELLNAEYSLAALARAEETLLRDWQNKLLTKKLAKQRLWEISQKQAELLMILSHLRAQQRRADDDQILTLALLL